MKEERLTVWDYTTDYVLHVVLFCVAIFLLLGIVFGGDDE